jgi:hypothetical protein
MLRLDLTVYQRDTLPRSELGEMRQRDFGSIGLAAEHRFAEEHPTQGNTIQATDELRRLPNFDCVGVA